MLGFLAFLVSRRQPLRTRLVVAAMTGVYVTLVAFSRLYLGAHWLSDVIGGISLALAWIALVAMVYAHRGVQEDFRPRQLMFVVAVSLAVFGGGWSVLNGAADLKRYALTDSPRVIPQGEWLAQGWRALPDRRLDVAGMPEEAFDLQWACGEANLGTRLDASGWRPAPAWSLQSTLGWLVPQSPLADHPVLPRFDRGKPSQLVFVRAAAQRPDERDVLRLWRSDVQVRGVGARPNLPVWYGAVYRESHATHWHLPSPGVRRVVLPAAPFAAQLPGDVQRQEQSGEPGRSTTVLALCL